MEAKDFSALRISLASPEQIRSWSYGEVTKPETINYRRLRPEMDGLFCERIFGPTRDWQCYCGKYKNIRYRGIICDKCGVEVTRAAVRRERMGHIELAAPVAHVWYTRRVPSYLGLLLDVSRRNLDRVLYFAQYVVTQVDEGARDRAIDRIQKELALKEQELVGDMEEQANGQRADQLAEEFESKVKAIREHFDGELARLSDEVMSEAQLAQRLVEDRLGQTALEAISLKSIEAVIVPGGETIANDHISRIQALVNDHLSKLQSEAEDMAKEEIAKISGGMDAANDGAEQLAELESRLETFREAAQKQIDELEKLQSLQFLAENPDRDKSKFEFFLSESRYRDLKGKFGNVFQASMGAEAFYDILGALNLTKMNEQLWQEVRTTRSKQRRKKATKRLRVVESLQNSSETVTDTDETNQENEPKGNRPEWMIMTALPVIPPDLRPMVQLDGGRFATSDLNDLYRRVINRNNRLKHLLDLGAPDVIVRNEKRMLQEAVDSLIDNSQRGKALSRRGRRELKSLSDMLKGKKGRFRRNLLGKRVDYSGRSVIVIGPKLKLHQCGLPKSMALELYRPFVISRLVHYTYASNVKGAKRIIERERPEVWEVLEEVIKERPVLLNRAPTLHRLGIQAFEPLLVEGKAIQIHPLVCSAFNADFDGDQMAVHIPLSDQAVKEARELMLSTKNLLQPSDGMPVVGPSKDMVLGNYYLTMDPTVEIVALKSRADEFRSEQVLYGGDHRVGIAAGSNGYYYAQFRKIPNAEIFEDGTRLDASGRPKVVETAVDRTVQALLEGEVDCMLANAYEMKRHLRGKGLEDRLEITNLHERRAVVDMDEVEYLYRIGLVQLHTPILLGNVYDQRSRQEEPEICTVGRAIFNRILPDEMRFVQKTMGKKDLQELVARCYQVIGAERTTDVVDAIKNYGFHYATISGTTIAVSDLTIPDERDEILQRADNVVTRADRDFRRGLMTEEERYQITIDEWKNAKDHLQERIEDALDPYGPVAIMATSGSTKGGFGTITQLAGMRGLMADPAGRIIELPIRSHFREGLNALEYFISTHGARKGLADTALRTADAGYLTRRLVDVAQDMIVNRWDCNTSRGLTISRSDDIAGQTIAERIVGRCAAEDVHHSEEHEIPPGWDIHVSDGQDIGEGKTIASHREEHEIPPGWDIQVSDGQDIGEGKTIASHREERISKASGTVRIEDNIVSVELGCEISPGWDIQVTDGEVIKEGAAIAAHSEELKSLMDGTVHIEGSTVSVRARADVQYDLAGWDIQVTDGEVIEEGAVIASKPLRGVRAREDEVVDVQSEADDEVIEEGAVIDSEPSKGVIAREDEVVDVQSEADDEVIEEGAVIDSKSSKGVIAREDKAVGIQPATDGEVIKEDAVIDSEPSKGVIAREDKAVGVQSEADGEDIKEDAVNAVHSEELKASMSGTVHIEGNTVSVRAKADEQYDLTGWDIKVTDGQAIEEGAIIASHSETLASPRAGTVHIEGNVVYICDGLQYEIPAGWDIEVTDGQAIKESAVIACHIQERKSSLAGTAHIEAIKKGGAIVAVDGYPFRSSLAGTVHIEDSAVYIRTLIAERNDLIDEEIASIIDKSSLEEVAVRSPLTCDLIHGVCALCYGRDLGSGEMVKIGAAVGIIAAQSIGEPGTQLTLRTFHTGGTVKSSGGDITSGLPRVVELFEARQEPKGQSVMTDIGGILRLTQREDGADIATVIDSEVFSEEHEIPPEWVVHVTDEKDIKEGAVIASHGEELKSSMAGKVYIEGNAVSIRAADGEDIKEVAVIASLDTEEPSRAVAEYKDEVVGIQSEVDGEDIKEVAVIASPDTEEPSMAVTEYKDEVIAIRAEADELEYEISDGWGIWVTDGEDIKEGAVIASHSAELRSSMAGKVHIEGNTVYIRAERRDEQEYEIPANARLRKEIHDGMEVKPGQQLTEGSKNPHRILRVLGPDATQLYLLSEIQEVYRSQGVSIADKHFETVIRKMMCKVQITQSGDSDLLPGELIDQLKLLEINEALIAEDKEPALVTPVLLGITKAALNTESYLSAASFQHTIKVLAGAAIEGKVDPLHGLKENVIIGKLIPAGTGFEIYQERESPSPDESLPPDVALEAQDTLGLDELGDQDDFENMLSEP